MARTSYQATLTLLFRTTGSQVLNRHTWVCEHQHRDRPAALRCKRQDVRACIDRAATSSVEMVGLDYRALSADERAGQYGGVFYVR